jgi:death on curing protein
MTEPRWITHAQIVRIHDEQLAIFGGPSGLRDAGLLQSAIDRPRNEYTYGETKLAALTAVYAFGLARNRPFVDGNKRAAFVSIVVFLEKNGVDVDLSQPDAVQVILELAAGKLTEAELATWIEKHV